MATGQRTTPADVAAPDALSVIRGDAGDAYRYRLDVYRTAHVDNLQVRSADAHAAVAALIEAARAVELKVRPYAPQRPYSADSYIPTHLRESLAAALARFGGAA